MPVTNDLKFNDDFYVRDPAKKGKEWGDRMVTAFRGIWQPIVDTSEIEKNRAIVNAKQDLADVKKGFKPAENNDGFLENTKWTAIAIYHRIVKILMAEFIKSAYNPDVEAIDVTAGNKKKRDKDMLQNRSQLEGVMNALSQQVGDPQYKMPLDDFEGNVEDFDKMGLSADDSDDIEFFFSTFYRLWQEISAEKLTRALMLYNEFNLFVRPLIVDLICSNTMVFQTFASPYTGEIKWFHHKPEVIKAIKGDRDDYKDAMCKGLEKNVTVRQWLEFAGKEFDWQKESHRDALRRAVNTFNGTMYTQIDASGACWEPNGKGILQISCDFASLLTRHRVGCAYIEWLSIDGIAYKKNKETGIRDSVGYDYEVQSEKYVKETEEVEKIYKAWMLILDSNSQMLFRYGRLYHQITEGGDDEYVSYSIHIVQSPDQCIVDITKPYNNIVQLAFYKMLWGIYESHPTVDYYDYNAIIDVIANSKPQNSSGTGDSMFENGVMAHSNVEGQFEELMKTYTGSLKRIFVRPERPQGGVDKPHFSEPGGLDPISVAMTTVLDWAESKVMDQIGMGARSPETPNPKLGKAVQQLSYQTSENATFDVPFMLSLLIKMVATSSLRIAQDAIQYKTKVYSWLETMIEKDDIMSIKSLDGVPFHRYSIFVDVFNSQKQLDKAKDIALRALTNKEIDNAQYALIENMDDAKMVYMSTAYYAQKTRKRMQREAELAHQRQMEVVKAQNDGTLAVEAARKDREMSVENLKGQYYVAANKSVQDAALAKKQIDVDSNEQKVNEKADANIREKREAANLAAQAPLPTSVSELQGQEQAVA